MRVSTSVADLLRTSRATAKSQTTGFDFERWSVGKRLALLVAAVALPLIVLIAAVVWNLARTTIEAQRTSLLYTARSVAAGVDAQLGKYIAVAESLARSPALLADNLDAFEKEAVQTLTGVADAWVLVADLDGQQLLNTSAAAVRPLVRRGPMGIAAQQRALNQRTLTISGVRRGTVVHDWVATVEIPIFKDQQPFRALSVTMSLPAFLKLLSGQEMPEGWLAGIIDMEGRFVARVPNRDDKVGQLASEGWRAVQGREGVFEFASLEGDTVVQGNALSKASGWAIGIAVRKTALMAGAWSTIRWTVLSGCGLLALSLLLAGLIARSITEPLAVLRKNADALVDGSTPDFRPGAPEIAELWKSLERAIEDRNSSQMRLQQVSDRLAAIVTSSTDAIASKDLNSNITSWNASAERMFGYSSAEMVGHPIRRLFPPDRQIEEDEIFARLRRGESVRNYETVRLDKHGHEIDVSVTVSPLHDAAGKLIGASTFIRDISLRKLNEKKLRESEQRLSQIINTVNAYIGLLDSAGLITEVNTKALEISGASRESVIGKHLADAPWWSATADGAARMRDIVARCLKGETVRCDLPYANGRGELRWVDFQAAPIVAPDGTVTAIVPSGVDITERKNSEHHIRLLMLEINHRAKNMLGLVSAIARQTAAASPTEFVARFAERIQSLSANHDLLVHSEWKGIDIAEVVRVQLAPFADLIGKRISVAGPSLTLRAQAAQSIGMALHELSTNAGKYGALSSAKGHVDISWTLEEGELRIGWVESGGPPVEKPVRRGFGTTVLTSLAQMSVGGKVQLIYDPAGLVWRLACPADKALEGGGTQARAESRA